MHAPLDALLQVEWVPLAALEGVVAQWQDLAGRALEPNVFYTPAFARAAAPVFGHGLGAGLVWSNAAGHRLVGLFPARIAARRYGLPLPVLAGWTHPFAPLGTPLVDRTLAQPVIAAWLDHVAANPALPKRLLWPFLPEGGPFAAALDAVLMQSRRRSAAFGRHARAMLAPGKPDPDYLQHALGAKKRKELRRQRHRLADAGAVAFISATEPAAVTDGLRRFLAVEAAGWKGCAGTAAANDDRIRAFITEAVSALADEGRSSVHCLMVGDRAVAAGIVLRSGDTAWFWKTAYDESLARLSPGVLLAADLTAMLAGRPDLSRTDSCAVAGHPMIEHLWRERLPLCDRLIAAGGTTPAFTLACRLEGARRAAIAGAKALRDRLQRSSFRGRAMHGSRAFVRAPE